MHEIMSYVSGWLALATEHPLITAGVVIVALGFLFVSNWKPKSTRDAESRLREIRDETHDYYRHLRPPGR